MTIAKIQINLNVQGYEENPPAQSAFGIAGRFDN